MSISRTCLNLEVRGRGCEVGSREGCSSVTLRPGLAMIMSCMAVYAAISGAVRRLAMDI